MSVTAAKPAKKQNWFRRHKIITGIIAAIILVSIGSAMGSSDNSNTSATNSSSSSSSSKKTASTQAPAAPGLNQQANDGKIGFTATAFKCGVPQIEQPGDQYGTFTTSAKAPYCVLSLSMKGIGNQAQNFDDDAQYLYATNGTQYSADDDATFDANSSDSNCTLSPGINPGVTLDCSLVFDVPTGVSISYAKLHDSAASGGVRVDL